MDKRLKFNEPWILQRADPYVYEKDGWYYFTASVPAYDSIVLQPGKKTGRSSTGRGSGHLEKA